MSQLHDLYVEALPEERQRINQAVRQRIEVDADNVSSMVLTDPMAALVAEDLVREIEVAESKNPDHLVGERGSRLDVLVEARGLEPPNLLTASQALYQLSYAPGTPLTSPGRSKNRSAA